MLDNFNEGRSKSYYCVVATVMKIEDIKEASEKAKKSSYGLDVKSRSKVLHSILDELAQQKRYYLGLRKRSKL
jgi:acyl-CoA reductase-like NAD-dependent aldehyde dehydrogenase